MRQLITKERHLLRQPNQGKPFNIKAEESKFLVCYFFLHVLLEIFSALKRENALTYDLFLIIQQNLVKSAKILKGLMKF